MARALARGWGRPVLCFDPVAERARALAEETGGEALASNAEVASRAELVVLCHKPAQLRPIAEELVPHARAVASILAATPARRGEGRLPRAARLPLHPLTARRGSPGGRRAGGRPGAGGGVLAGALAVEAIEEATNGGSALDAQVRELFAELGSLVVLDDALLDVATGLMSCAPAYVALVAEAQIDAGVRRGIPAAEGAQLVVQTLAGTAELLRRRGYDTLALRREVCSPGGLTARGVDALERGGVRAAFSDALDAVLRRRGAPAERGRRR